MSQTAEAHTFLEKNRAGTRNIIYEIGISRDKQSGPRIKPALRLLSDNGS